MVQIAKTTSMKDIWDAWGNVQRSGARMCRTIHLWKEAGAITHENVAARDWQTYLAGALKISKSRVYQLERAGRVFCALEAKTTNRRLLDSMSEAHLRHLTPAADDPELLDEVWEKIDEQWVKTKKAPRKADVKKVMNEAVERREPDAPEVAPAPLPAVGINRLTRLADMLKLGLEDLTILARRPPTGVSKEEVEHLRVRFMAHQETVKDWTSRQSPV